LHWQSQRNGIIIEKETNRETTGGTAVVVMNDHVNAAGMHHAQMIPDSKLY
jgi:hypothetical protein